MWAWVQERSLLEWCYWIGTQIPKTPGTPWQLLVLGNSESSRPILSTRWQTWKEEAEKEAHFLVAIGHLSAVLTQLLVINNPSFFDDVSVLFTKLDLMFEKSKHEILKNSLGLKCSKSFGLNALITSNSGVLSELLMLDNQLGPASHVSCSIWKVNVFCSTWFWAIQANLIKKLNIWRVQHNP